MPKSTNPVQTLLRALSGMARDAGWSDAEWARRSGLPKETLCRLRSRSNCDVATLAALSNALGMQLTAGHPSVGRSHATGLWPTVVDRRFEARLIDLLRSGSTSEAKWRELGPRPPAPPLIHTRRMVLPAPRCHRASGRVSYGADSE